MRTTQHLQINGEAVEVEADGSALLLDVLRNRLGLKAARFGCGEEACGSCMVLIDGEPAFSCTRAIDSLAGRAVTTLEGLKANGALEPLLQAFIAEQAGQCGYCLSGIVMSAYALLARNPSPGRAEIVAALEPHLCRCGSHQRIIRAVERAAGGRP
jgi:aerobic-type carbon monoxide dehydrogenase small subunit (CoxS/CutS family)